MSYDNRDSAGIGGLLIMLWVCLLVFFLGFIIGGVFFYLILAQDTPQAQVFNCTTINPICEDRSAYYISCPDSNYLVKCPVQPDIYIKDAGVSP
jgi:hypothetical protein